MTCVVDVIAQKRVNEESAHGEYDGNLRYCSGTGYGTHCLLWGQSSIFRSPYLT